MLATIETLSEIRHCCEVDKALDARHRAWLAEALAKFLENRCASLNEAFGVIQERGGMPWWRERAMLGRDAALRELARRHLPGLTVYAQAKEIARLSRRYAGSSWRRDEESSAMPSHYEAKPQEQLWTAFKSGAPMPLSERRLRSLLV